MDLMSTAPKQPEKKPDRVRDLEPRAKDAEQAKGGGEWFRDNKGFGFVSSADPER
jgi:hypothetical protein